MINQKDLKMGELPWYGRCERERLRGVRLGEGNRINLLAESDTVVEKNVCKL